MELVVGQNYELYCHRPFRLKDKRTHIPGLISLGTGHYYHGAWLYWEGDNPMVLESLASINGLRKLTLEQWLETRKGDTIDRLASDIVLEPEWAEWYISQCEGYDFASVFWCLIVYRIFHVWLGRMGTAIRKPFCFELIAHIKKDQFFYRHLPRGRYNT